LPKPGGGHLSRQGFRRPSLLFNVSKQALNLGANFWVAYASPKRPAGLMRQYALGAGGEGIRATRSTPTDSPGLLDDA